MKKNSLTLIGMVMMVVFALSVNTDNQDELGIKNAKALADVTVTIRCDDATDNQCCIFNTEGRLIKKGRGRLVEITTVGSTTTITAIAD